MNFDYCEKYLRGISSKILLLTKYIKQNIILIGSAHLIFSLQIDKKVRNFKENTRRKTDTNEFFSNCLALMRF